MATKEQIDFLYSEIDAVLSTGVEYHIVDDFLNWWTAKVKSASDEEFDVDWVLAVLTATLPAKSKLPHRKIYFDAVAERLKNHPEKEELLKGLE